MNTSIVQFVAMVLLFGGFAWVAYRAIRNARNMRGQNRGQVHSGERIYLPPDQRKAWGRTH